MEFRAAVPVEGATPPQSGEIVGNGDAYVGIGVMTLCKPRDPRARVVRVSQWGK